MRAERLARRFPCAAQIGSALIQIQPSVAKFMRRDTHIKNIRRERSFRDGGKAFSRRLEKNST